MSSPRSSLRRRDAIAAASSVVGLSALSAEAAAAQQDLNRNAPVPAKDNLKITKLETILVKPRWLFLKIHTNAGIVGLGEPITEGRALTCAEAVKEIEPYLVGKDPAPGRQTLAGDLPARLLSGRPDSHQRAQRHRPGSLGYQGQGARCPCL